MHPADAWLIEQDVTVAIPVIHPLMLPGVSSVGESIPAWEKSHIVLAMH
jgi:hypothetical protein